MNSVVNQNEADALKEMIFKRVRERTQSVTDDVQADVMELARDSFVSGNNPFAKIADNSGIQATQTKTFPKEPAVRIRQSSTEINRQIASSAVRNNMLEAREALSSKQSFMGALNFLNSQAAISLMRTRSDKFEVVV